MDSAASRLSMAADPEMSPDSSNEMLVKIPSEGSNFETETVSFQLVVWSGMESE